MSLASSTWRDGVDDSLSRNGQTIVITRTLAGGSTISVSMLASVRTTVPQEDIRGLNPTQMIGPTTQPDMKVIISGSELDAANWPLTDGLPLPLRTDSVTINGKSRTIQIVTPILVGDVLARIELTVRG